AAGATSSPCRPTRPGRASATAVRRRLPRAQVEGRSQPMPETASIGKADVRVSPRRIELWLPIAIVVLDQITKAMVRARLPLYASRTIIPGFMDFTHVPNSGIAYGLLQNVDFPFKAVLIAMIAAAAMVSVGLYASSQARHQLIARIGLALI